MALLCAVFGAVLAYGQAVAVRHRAAGGADLAALAAADHWAEGGPAACARAGRLAAVQGVRLVRCAIVGDTSDVTATVRTGPFTAQARARAGPPGPVPPGSPEGLQAVPPAPAPPGPVPPDIPDGLRALPPAELGPPGPVPVPPGIADGVRTVPPVGPRTPGPLPPGIQDGPRSVPPAEPGTPSDPPSP
ncbi:Rv3654c family TadE-like protein [Streptomyces achromogenes]|uniref:Rv3654c family TadE-like protein n=1 Tax=Streptomyces achromogenes TaxID=67255 RepID=UPI003A80D084